MLSCDLCQETFKQRTALKTHMTKSHPEVECQYQCASCQRVFKYKSTIEEHVTQKHKDSKKTYTKHLKNIYSCELCQDTFKHKSALGSHMKKSHAEKPSKESYECEKCDVRFELEDDFLEHIFAPHK